MIWLTLVKVKVTFTGVKSAKSGYIEWNMQLQDIPKLQSLLYGAKKVYIVLSLDLTLSASIKMSVE